MGNNDLTLLGTGTLSDVDLTTGANTRTITAGSGAGVTISALDPGFTGAGGTLLFAGSGNTTVTAINANLPGNGDRIQKTGTGTLTLTPGITTSFANGTGVKLDIDGGTVVVGVAGTNDDITFNDDGDEITVASGATLTTFGSFSVGAAGTNVNLDAATGSTVNLNSTAGAETITAAADDDYNLLGTVNIAGSNGDYTISDAFDYKFGNVNINTTGSLINKKPNAEMEFVPGSTIALTGSGTLNVNGQSTTTPITMDTTTGTGTFTINRGSTGVLTLQNVALSNATYVGAGKAAGCELTLNGVNIGFGTSNWICVAGGGGVDQTGDTVSDEGDTQDPDAETDVIVDAEPETPADTEEGPLSLTDTDIAAGDGTAELSSESVVASVEGLDEGTPVSLETDASGMTTLIVGDTENPDLTFTLDGVGEGFEINVAIGDDGDQTLMVTSPDGSEVLDFSVAGLGAGVQISASIEANGDQTVVVSGESGPTFTLDLNALPEASQVEITVNDDGSLRVDVTDPAGEAVDVSIVASAVGEQVVFHITYNDTTPIDGANLRLVGSLPGFENNESLGGSVTINATGLVDDAAITVSLTYADSDLAGIAERDLRLLKRNAGTGTFELPGTNDVGVSATTGVLGDFGVNTAENSAWAEVSELGTFAVGVPALSPTDRTDELGCAAGGGLCGTMGMIPLTLTVCGLIGLRRRGRRRNG